MRRRESEMTKNRLEAIAEALGTSSEVFFEANVAQDQLGLCSRLLAAFLTIDNDADRLRALQLVEEIAGTKEKTTS
jgi:hypothetical protein